MIEVRCAALRPLKATCVVTEKVQVLLNENQAQKCRENLSHYVTISIKSRDKCRVLLNSAITSKMGLVPKTHMVQ